MPPIPPHMGGGSAPYKARSKRKKGAAFTPSTKVPAISAAAKNPSAIKAAAGALGAPVAQAARRGRKAAPFKSRRSS